MNSSEDAESGSPKGRQNPPLKPSISSPGSPSLLIPQVLFLKSTSRTLIVEQVGGGAKDGERQVINLDTYLTATELLDAAARLPFYFPGLSVEVARAGVWAGHQAQGAYERRYALTSKPVP